MLGQEINICEIGCGAGGVLASLLLLMKNIGITCRGVGYDISPVAIERARGVYPDLNFEVNEATHIKRKFDVVLLIDVLEHVPSPANMLMRCFEMSPLVLIHLPLDYHYWGMALYGRDYFDYLKRDRGHIHYYTKKSALNLIESAQGEVIAWKYTRWGLEHDSDSSKSGKLAKILRRIAFNFNMNLGVRLLGGASIVMLCVRQSSSSAYVN